MTTINRSILNICSDKLAETSQFYQSLLDFNIEFESEWYIQLRSASLSGLELGLIDRKHELIPEAFRNFPQGTYLTFVVDDVEAVYAIAQKNGYHIVQPPHDTFYGQRRLLLTDPDGLLVDISALMR